MPQCMAQEYVLKLQMHGDFLCNGLLPQLQVFDKMLAQNVAPSTGTYATLLMASGQARNTTLIRQVDTSMNIEPDRHAQEFGALKTCAGMSHD